MARRSKSKTKRKLAFSGRRVAVVVLTVVGLLFLVSYGAIHWTHRQLLTTENWVTLVAPIPKDEQVSAALADYSVNKAFEAVNVEQKISEALPQKAAFLAPALTERVDARATDLAQNFIQSDQFQGVWIAGNRVAHTKLMSEARDDTEQSSGKRAEFGLRLESLVTSVRDRLGITSQPLFEDSGGTESDVSLGVSLKSRLETFKKLVNTVDFLNAVLLLAALALLLGALAFSHARRRLLMIMLAVVSVVSLLQLIGVSVLRPEILNQVQNAAYQPAVGVIYDGLLASFKSTASTVFAASTTLFVIIFLAGRSFIKDNKYVSSALAELKKTGMSKGLKLLRLKVREYQLPIMGVGVFLVLVFMAFGPDNDWQGVIQAFLAILILVGLVSIVAKPPARSLATKKPRR